MHEGKPGEDFEFEEALAEADSLIRDFREHQATHIDPFYGSEKARTIAERTEELRALFDWLPLTDINSVTVKRVGESTELSAEYSIYDVEDEYFIILDALGDTRGVSFDDIISEPKETDIYRWQKQETSKAADFLILRGVDEEEMTTWRSSEGTGRQQRAIRRMYWLLRQPYMSEFANYLERVSREEETFKAYKFKDMAEIVYLLLNDQKKEHDLRDPDRSNWIPRKRDEYDKTTDWLQQTLRICEQVFAKDLKEKIYG